MGQIQYFINVALKLDTVRSVHRMNELTCTMFIILILYKFTNTFYYFNVGHPVVPYVHDQVIKGLETLFIEQNALLS